MARDLPRGATAVVLVDCVPGERTDISDRGITGHLRDRHISLGRGCHNAEICTAERDASQDEQRQQEDEDEGAEHLAVGTSAHESNIGVRLHIVEVLSVHSHRHLHGLAGVVLRAALDVGRHTHDGRLVDVHSHTCSKVFEGAQNSRQVATLRGESYKKKNRYKLN